MLGLPGRIPGITTPSSLPPSLGKQLLEPFQDGWGRLCSSAHRGGSSSSCRAGNAQFHPGITPAALPEQAATAALQNLFCLGQREPLPGLLHLEGSRALVKAAVSPSWHQPNTTTSYPGIWEGEAAFPHCSLPVPAIILEFPLATAADCPAGKGLSQYPILFMIFPPAVPFLLLFAAAAAACTAWAAPPSRRESLPPPLHSLAADVTSPKGQFRPISRLHPRQSRELSCSRRTQFDPSPQPPAPLFAQAQAPFALSAAIRGAEYSSTGNIPLLSGKRPGPSRASGSSSHSESPLNTSQLPAVPPGFFQAGIPLPVVCKALS